MVQVEKATRAAARDLGAYHRPGRKALAAELTTLTELVRRHAANDRPGGIQPGGTQPGGIQPGGIQPGGTQPGGTQPGDSPGQP